MFKFFSQTKFILLFNVLSYFSYILILIAKIRTCLTSTNQKQGETERLARNYTCTLIGEKIQTRRC